MIAPISQDRLNRLDVHFHEQHGDNDDVTLGNSSATGIEGVGRAIPLCGRKTFEIQSGQFPGKTFLSTSNSTIDMVVESHQHNVYRCCAVTD